MADFIIKPSVSKNWVSQSTTDVGLQYQKTNENAITTKGNTIIIDSKNLIGKDALVFSQNVATTGLSSTTYGFGTFKVINCTGKGVPVVITISSDENTIGSASLLFKLFNKNPFISINGIVGNTAANGYHKIKDIQNDNEIVLEKVVGNGNYIGGGYIYANFPYFQKYPYVPENASIVKDNTMYIKLNKTFRDIKKFSLSYISIPRNIIPISVYIPNFIVACLATRQNVQYPYISPLNSYESFIPQTREYLETYMEGMFSSPIDLWRSYINGAGSMPNTYTEAPLELWNPPQGEWPLQPPPYPYQTVPVYYSKEFEFKTVRNGVETTNTTRVITSGYGIYDLSDFTYNTVTPPYSETNSPKIFDIVITSILRSYLIYAIISYYYLNGASYKDIPSYVNFVDSFDVDYYLEPENANKQYFGYGPMQRFIPGPGMGMAYQPTGDPTVATEDSPVPFPYFRGNVWGPYDGPGARFQKMGVVDTLQDLYLNGDTMNLFGISPMQNNFNMQDIINNAVNNFGDVSSIMKVPMFQKVTFETLPNTTNYNILNAMRITPNGFGGIDRKVDIAVNTGETGPLYGMQYASNGGIGPFQGGPDQGGWNYKLGPSFNNPNAAGPQTTTSFIPQYADASYPGNDIGVKNIPNRVSWNDSVTGTFVQQITEYFNRIVNQLPDTNLVMNIEQVPRDQRVHTLNKNQNNAILSVPIRLTLGTVSGTFEYVESLGSLIADADSYWTKRFEPPLGQLERLNISFTSYNGTPIPLEKMLQPFNGPYIPNKYVGYQYTYSDRVDPRLINSVNRSIKIIFNVETYEYENPGLLNNIKSTLEKGYNYFIEHTTAKSPTQ